MADKKSKKIDKQFKKAERKLYDYTGLKADVECLEYELEISKQEYEGCKAITYSSETTWTTSSKTSNFKWHGLTNDGYFFTRFNHIL